MLKNIIFDFGDVFINLDKRAVFKGLGEHDINLVIAPELVDLNERFEVGAISPTEFVSEWGAIIPKLDAQEIVRIWNSILLDFPDYRLEFLEQLAAEKKYRLFLLSNTNALHIPKVQEIMGAEKYGRFKNCFERFYLSHEIGLRKPNFDIYEFVLTENRLLAKETLFIDDTEKNTDAAASLGIRVWHLKVGKEDIIQLSTRL
ncbi:HAD family phosphatase [Aggregatimonas sangjinii]|uniref:HAD family phosphatase n=1 Tax=Aggregatimonas sangjinii TaxID=2583587 RepID=A0A5B7SSJ3_9FLAO|nr:HAD family phosphatase [Aggregatimonas sangjinii]QCX00279.1 HAD family phosphatase [Aggregatimonas sangjinii]